MSEIPSPERTNPVTSNEKKVVTVPLDGPNVTRVLRTHLQNRNENLTEYPETRINFEIHNPGKDEVIIVLAGVASGDAERFRRGGLFHEIIRNLDATVVLFEWPFYPHVPEYTAAQVEDLCLAEGIKSVKLVGISYGGYAALELIADIQRNHIDLEVTGLVTVSSPVSAESFRMPAPIIEKLASILQGVQLRQMRSAGDNQFKKQNALQALSMTARVKGIKERPFPRSEMMNNVPVLAVTTKGERLINNKFGPPTPDLLVKNPESALRSMFDDVEVFEATGKGLIKGRKINPAGAHRISDKGGPAVNKKILEFLSKKTAEKTDKRERNV